MTLGTFEDAEGELKRLRKTVETPQSISEQESKTKKIENVLRITQNFSHVQATLSNVPNPFKPSAVTEKSVEMSNQGKSFE